MEEKHPKTEEQVSGNIADSNLGDVAVVGGGISGIQASLDLAGAGFKVYLIEKSPTIGGHMAQLDKTFPTNDCSMCILSPKFIECATNPNISIITGAEVDGIEGEAGNFTITLLQKPRYIDEKKCTGCGTCTEYCPVYISDAYNENLATVKCIHTPFPQAVPAVSLIDFSQCLFLRRQECQICVPACKNKAINFHQEEKRVKIEAGSVILAPGYEIFKPQLQSRYGYQRFCNVVTSLEFERMLSASGPQHGELLRPSDAARLTKIAWIQCVGSRDSTTGNSYCSAVCCMYSIKQVILAKDHNTQLEAVIFHNDVRAYGKGFEQYYERARKTPGVRFTRSYISIGKEIPESKNVVIRYSNARDGVKEEEFDLVVLSVGMTSTESTRKLAHNASVKTNSYGFCEGAAFSRVESSRPGIYVCGTFHAPMDIPDSVTMASAAASLASQLLSDRRGRLVEEKKYPPEREVRSEPPRVGVFLCDCGTNIVRVVDVAKVVEYAKGLNGVIHAEENTFGCSIDSISHMIETIRERGLNRVVVAACTPRTHEPVFQNALKEAGLNPYLFEMTNVREQCSWVHTMDRQMATQKAQDLVRMAVAKATLLEALYQLPCKITPAALVIGGGISGMVSALILASQGIKVHLVEKAEELGGIAKRIQHTLEGEDVQVFLKELMSKVYGNLLIQVHTGATVTEFTGYVGNFRSKIKVEGERKVREIAHGVTIVATGAEEFRPAEYLYAKDPRVITLLELEEEIARKSERVKSCDTIVMIQCVGSRENGRPYCSRICCSQALKNALKLKAINPKIDIYILYRDMRSYGFKEDYYREAATQGVNFIRYEVEDKPEVALAEDNGRSILRVTVTDSILGKRLVIDTDAVSLAVSSVPSTDNRRLSQLLKVPLNEDGFFMEAHMKLRPVDFATDGIFLCGLAHSPKFIAESIAQAQAAASRALTILSKEEIKTGGTVCFVHGPKCTGCALCQKVCPFGAIEVDAKERIAVVNEALCKGCGVCVSSCRSGALDLGGTSEMQTWAVIQAL